VCGVCEWCVSGVCRCVWSVWCVRCVYGYELYGCAWCVMSVSGMCEVYMSMVVCEGVYGVCGVYIYECEHVYMCWLRIGKQSIMNEN